MRIACRHTTWYAKGVIRWWKAERLLRVVGVPLRTFGHVLYERSMIGRHSAKPPEAPDAPEQVQSQRPLTIEQLNEIIGDSWATAGVKGLDAEVKPKAN